MVVEKGERGVERRERRNKTSVLIGPDKRKRWQSIV